jgi:hypothetical protein
MSEFSPIGSGSFTGTPVSFFPSYYEDNTQPPPQNYPSEISVSSGSIPESVAWSGSSGSISMNGSGGASFNSGQYNPPGIDVITSFAPYIDDSTVFSVTEVEPETIIQYSPPAGSIARAYASEDVTEALPYPPPGYEWDRNPLKRDYYEAFLTPISPCKFPRY